MYSMRILLACLILWSLTLPLAFERRSSAQSDRGQRVKIKVEKGQEIDLYDESHALVIGVSRYTNGWHNLDGVTRDVQAVEVVLKKQGFSVKTVPNPGHDALDQALRDFISQYGLRERNRLLIYFAGHGYTEEFADGRDQGYIVPADAPLPEKDPTLFNRRAISMDEMDAFARRIRAKHALFIFDSCFSGSIFDARGELRTPPEIESKTAAPVRQFITSGTKKQAVPDDSIFRAYFVRAFEQREGDLNGDGFITGDELGIYLSGRVAGESRDAQTPRFGKIRDVRLNLGDFVFALPKKEAPPAPRPEPPVVPSYLAEQALWDTVKDSNDAAEIETYTRKYCPNGIFCDAANIRLTRLKAKPTPTPTPKPTPTPTPTPKPTPTPMPAVASFSFETVRLDKNGKEIGARVKGQKSYFTEDLGNGVKLEMVEIPGGTFQMGSPANEADRQSDEGPQHSVNLSSFWMGKFEVTQAQWQAVMGNNPSNFKGDGNLPVEQVSWDDVQEFLKKLNGLPNLQGGTYRLPTEAEWEYAARAGTTTPFAFGETITPDTANYRWDNPYANAPKKKNLEKTLPVGSFKIANAFGLFDMHGNVWEWCSDWYAADYYAESQRQGTVSDPRGPSTGSNRVLRGGGWDGLAVLCRSANRSYFAPGDRRGYLGFRLVRIGR